MTGTRREPSENKGELSKKDGGNRRGLPKNEGPLGNLPKDERAEGLPKMKGTSQKKGSAETKEEAPHLEDAALPKGRGEIDGWFPEFTGWRARCR